MDEVSFLDFDLVKDRPWFARSERLSDRQCTLERQVVTSVAVGLPRRMRRHLNASSIGDALQGIGVVVEHALPHDQASFAGRLQDLGHRPCDGRVYLIRHISHGKPPPFSGLDPTKCSPICCSKGSNSTGG